MDFNVLNIADPEIFQIFQIQRYEHLYTKKIASTLTCAQNKIDVRKNLDA